LPIFANIFRGDRKGFLLPGLTENRVALVTGARSGIGAETCFALRDLGVKIVALDRKYERGLNLHPHGLLVGADVSQAAELRSIWPEVLASSGPIDFLINSAGVQEASGLPWEVDLRGLADTFMTNALGPLLMTALVVESMPSGGVILNISSYAGVYGYPDYAAYSMSKGSLFILARALRGPLSERGLRLTTLIPGPAATPMQFQDVAWPALLHPATIAKVIVDCVSRPRTISVEELWIRAVDDGESAVEEGSKSRTWPPAI
jgi:meso-butanediol dehydrogenase / (S,S)-butanediol dehydrogenase / diacetyl reductase